MIQHVHNGNVLQVKDRMVVKTTDFERKCVSPVGLQYAIDVLVAGKAHGRSFVRYSMPSQVASLTRSPS